MKAFSRRVSLALRPVRPGSSKYSADETPVGRSVGLELESRSAGRGISDSHGPVVRSCDCLDDGEAEPASIVCRIAELEHLVFDTVVDTRPVVLDVKPL